MSDEPNNFLTQFQPDRNLFQAFAEKTDAVFWVADPVSFQLIYISPYAEMAFGISQQEWTRPLFWQTHLHSPDQERVLAGFKTAVGEQTTQQFEYRLKANDDTLVWIRNTVCVVTDETPKLCGMMTDVTGYKTAVQYSDDAPGYASNFLEIVTLLSENSDIKQRLDQLAEKLGTVFEITAVNILGWDSDWDIVTRLAHFRAAGFSTLFDQNSYSLAGLEGSLKWLSAVRPVLIHINDPSLSKWEESYLQKYNAKTVLYLPLREQNELIGCIELIESRTQRNFTQNDIELGHKIAQQTALTLARAHLFQKEARRRREAEILLDVAEFISSSLDRDEILRRVMEMIRVYLNDVQNCAISLITKDGKRLETILSWWANDEFSLMPTGQIIQIKDTFSAQLAIEGGEPVVLSDLKEIPFSNVYIYQRLQEGLRAILCVPLKIQNRAMGTLHVHYWHQPRQFTAEEIALVQGVANQTAIAIENARLFANERRQLRLSQTLQKVGSLLTASLQLEEVYEQIFGLLDKVVSYSAAFLYLFDELNDQFNLAAFRGIDEALATNPPPVLPSDLLLSQISLPPGWVVISDVDRYDPWIDYSGDGLIKSWIGALLVVKGEMIGILNIDGAMSRQFSDEDGQMVAAFANQAAIAIENARLHDETMRQTKELAILNQVAQETAVSLNIDTFLEKITKRVAADIYPHMFGFALLTDDDKELVFHSSGHGIPDKIKRSPFRLTQGITGHVYQTGLPYIAPNVREDPYYYGFNEITQSEAVVPLKVNHEVIGVINVESGEKDAFSSRDIGFLMTLAGNIAAVLERARLYDTLHIQAAGLAEQVAERTKELQFERDRLFTILESAGEGIILTDTEARIVYVNQAMERQSGYSRDELIDENPRIFGSKQMPKSTFAEMWHHLLNHERWVGELINQNKDGKNYDVSVTVTPIVGADEIVTGYISVQSDISRLKELDRLKRQFIANVSHQLRTPLTNIKTYVSLLEKGKPEKFPRYFSVLHFETDRLARLIQDLLDISRLDAEGPPNPNAATNFNEFWQKFWPPIIEQAAWENRTIETIFPDDVRTDSPIIFMEAYQLEKVMSRLIENALAYSDKDSKIQIIVAWGEQRMLEIMVCDEGMGVPEAERPFIFDRFFRGAQAIESGLPGNGLGLAIVKELLVRYGGDIFLESEVRNGCCFTLHLPLKNQNGNTGFLHD
jgi:PAS domain S-box-containing protein